MDFFRRGLSTFDAISEIGGRWDKTALLQLLDYRDSKSNYATKEQDVKTVRKHQESELVTSYFFSKLDNVQLVRNSVALMNIYSQMRF